MQARRLIRVYVDANLCVGAGMCTGAHPDAFRIQPDGHAAYVGPGIDEAAALEAAELCPVSAIQLVYEGDE